MISFIFHWLTHVSVRVALRKVLLHISGLASFYKKKKCLEIFECTIKNIYNHRLCSTKPVTNSHKGVIILKPFSECEINHPLLLAVGCWAKLWALLAITN